MRINKNLLILHGINKVSAYLKFSEVFKTSPTKPYDNIASENNENISLPSSIFITFMTSTFSRSPSIICNVAVIGHLVP